MNVYGDAAIWHGETQYITGLDIDEFHAYRYESPDGSAYSISVDGVTFIEGVDDGPYSPHFVAFGGHGGCLGDHFPNMVNEWDFVRYGTLSDGERLVSSDPPGGYLDPGVFAGIDRFTITFDQPGYVYIEDVAVQVTGAGVAPAVMQTRRLDNAPPETVEIVLDGPLPIGETTTFTFDTGLEPPEENVLSYTLAPPPIGACCDDATGVCRQDVALPDCDAAGGRFGGEASTCMTIDPPCLPPPLTGACCEDATGVCTEDLTQGDCESATRRYGGDDSTCATIDPPCVPPPPTGACCNDATGLCSGDVTQSDCKGSGRRYGGDDSDCSTIDPPCASAAIPATSTWGMVVLAIILLVAGEILFGRSAHGHV